MEDLTGKRFGDIQVLEYNKDYSEEYSTLHHHRRYFWNCLCTKCGEITTRNTGNILRIKNSGCNTCHGVGRTIGEIFGSLKVLSLNEEETKKKTELYGHSVKAYNCECINCHTKSVKIRSELVHYKKVGTNGCKECNRVDLTGQRFGRLMVIGLAEQQEWGKQMWFCQCDCGKTCVHQTGDLTKKDPVQSCGCLQREAASKTGKRTIYMIGRNAGRWNGDTSNPKYVRLYCIWSAMRHRCYHDTNVHYEQYGGRGIKVCDEWKDNWFAFRDWAMSHGYTDELTIDRINNNGNYEPNNCRWVSQQVQSNNTRANKYLEYKGRVQTLAEWCRELNLDYYRTKARLNTCGYTVEEAFELSRYEYR